MNVFDSLSRDGNDDGFEPETNALHLPTEASPGSPQKVEILRLRAELGLPLWHECDEAVCSVIGVGDRKVGFAYPLRDRKGKHE